MFSVFFYTSSVLHFIKINSSLSKDYRLIDANVINIFLRIILEVTDTVLSKLILFSLPCIS